MPTWTEVLATEKKSQHFLGVQSFVAERRAQGHRIYPPASQTFAAFKATAFDDIKIVILGQDPYHGDNQANGLCFSVNPGIALPPSLKNIFKELRDDVAAPLPAHGDLSHWAKQGVLLLNTVLSVEAGLPQSHQGKGWEHFTDYVIAQVSLFRPHVVFLLWGSPAQRKSALIDGKKHTILTSVHPSPLSAYRGFLGCRHFSRSNAALIAHGQTPIDWNLPPP